LIRYETKEYTLANVQGEVNMGIYTTLHEYSSPVSPLVRPKEARPKNKISSASYRLASSHKAPSDPGRRFFLRMPPDCALPIEALLTIDAHRKRSDTTFILANA